jgi:translation initiation factor 6
MNIARTRLMGSNYIGLFGICNDKICLVPPSVEESAMKKIEEILEVKTVKTTLYASSLLAAFGKMNNKYAYIPKYANQKEIETIEKEIKVKIIDTEHALGNLMDLNDNGAIISRSLQKRAVEEITKTGLKVSQLNIARIEVVGSCLLATNKGFVVNPNATREEVETISTTLGVKGGSSTANTGDMFIRNSILANTKGILIGESTTPFEINRIEEALMGDEEA